MEDGESAGPVAVQIISSGAAPKERESSEDSRAKENGEDSKVETEVKEEKEKGALTAETHGIMQESAHIQKEKEKEDQLTNLLKETTKKKKKNQR